MDHISVPVADVGRAREFYMAALAPLGWTPKGFREGVYAGFHKPGSPTLYLHASSGPTSVHLAFVAESEAEVAAFHQAAVGAGGHDNGPPGPRPYGEAYYAAFVHDQDGHNVEAVVGGVRVR